MKHFLRKILPSDFILLSHKLRAILAAVLYRFPARHLKVVGITGTNGKTTTANMVANILSEANYKVALASTINFKIGDKEWVNKTKMTTASPFALQKFLRECVKAGCHWAVLETSSHAIAQYRNWGIRYDVAVLTNITHDHLDYHKTYEDYRDTKGKLFSSGHSVNILNNDEKATAIFSKFPSYQTFTYGLEIREGGNSDRPDVLAKKLILEPTGSMFTAVTPIGQTAIELKLPGKFNIYNALAAISVAVSLGVHLEIIKRALEKITNIPGRMEQVDIGQSFNVIVDYAHTPDALEKIYQTLTSAKKGRIISILGSCGDRDRSKRPILGALAGRFADVVIITNEDPYTEDPKKIIEEVSSGVPRGANDRNPKKEGENYFIIEDRKEAIGKAIEMARKDDIVLITGKGAEECMVWGDKKIPWSDRKIAKEFILKRMSE